MDGLEWEDISIFGVVKIQYLDVKLLIWLYSKASDSSRCFTGFDR
jgi:hypothetical protein